MIGIPQAVISPLSSVHGMYLSRAISDAIATGPLVKTHLKTTSLGKASPGLRVVIMGRFGKVKVVVEERRNLGETMRGSCSG